MPAALNFYKPQDLTILLTCENPTNGLSMSTTTMTLAAQAPGSTGSFGPSPDRTVLGVSNRDSYTGSNYQITNIIGIDSNIGKEKEEIAFFGRATKDHIFIRRMGEITITRKADSPLFAALAVTSSAGLDDAGSINNHDEFMTTGSGFRLHVILKSGEGVYTLQNCIIRDYKPSPAAAKSNEETFTLQTHIWTLSAAPYTVSSAVADM